MFLFGRAGIAAAVARSAGLVAAVASVVTAALASSAAVAVAAAANDAPDDPIERVARLVQAADFDAAELAARATLASGTLDRSRAARVYLQLGIVGAARHDDESAVFAFGRALALDPALELPAFAGPHVVRPFQRAREEARAAPAVRIAARIGRGRVDGEIDVRVTVGGDRTALARRVRVRGGSCQEVRDIGEGELRLSAVCPEILRACVAFTAGVLDQYGNELWPAIGAATLCPPLPAVAVAPVPQSAPAPAPATAVASTADAVLSGRPAPAPALARPTPGYVWATGALAGALAVTTGVVGGVALSRRDDYESRRDDPGVPYETKVGLHDRAASAEQWATAAFVATGAAALTTIVLYLMRGHGESHAR
jgi:hypothetical protein